MKIHGVQAMPPVRPGLARPGQVDEYFARAFEFNEIVSRDRMVMDIRELHPMTAGIRLVEERGWEREDNEATPGVRVYFLWNPQNKTGYQQAAFNETTGETSLQTGFMAFRQWVAMDKEGRIIRDTGRVII